MSAKRREGVKRRLQRAPVLYGAALTASKALEIRRGAWIEPELQLVRELVAPGETAIDVGANYGLWSWHLARAGSRVVAFEPIPATARAMRRIMHLLGVGASVEVHAAGCGERMETGTFRIPIAWPGGPAVAGLAHMAGTEGTEGWKTTEASIVTLDDAVKRDDVSFVKVDVEGAELFVLRGADRILSEQQPTVVCEIGRGLLQERYGIEVRDLVELMEGHGYTFTRLENGELRQADVSRAHDGNYVFVSGRYRNRLAPARASAAAAAA
ncbi:MAG: FkbM family methyltransferase [Actinomycetota bacterium]|nr:FkbM family methyltransferase [Actinomycetota bacterium]